MPLEHHSDIVSELRQRLASTTRNRVVELLRELRPEDIAAALAEVDDVEVEQIFDRINREDPQLAAVILALLERHDVARLLGRLPDDKVADVLESLPPDDATWALELLPEERVGAVVAAMEEPESREVRERLEYPEDSAGRLMSEEYVALSEEATAGDAIRVLQQAEVGVTVVCVYLVDGRGHLTGVVSLRNLLRVKPGRRLEELSPAEVVRASVLDDQEDVARVFVQNDFVCLPVVDEQGVLVGVVTHDDVLDVLREEATEDMLQMAGTSAEDVIVQSVWTSARVRMPWLLFSLIGGILAMKLLDFQENRLGELFLTLTLFVPVIVGMGGNLGTQAATLVVRGLATGRVRRHDALPVFWRELRTAAVVGLFYGALLTVAARILLQEPMALCAVVGGSLLMSMLIASTLGTMLPIAFHAAGIDPAVATGPLVTTTMDIVGIIVYMSVAGWALIAL